MKLFSHIQIGRYYPIESPIHSLEGVVKILCALLLMLGVLLVNSPYSLLIFTLMIFTIVFLSALPPLQVLSGLRSIMVILAITALVQLLFAPGKVIWKFGPIEITNAGLTNGLFYSLRIILLTLIISLLTLTTPPTELLKGFSTLMSPLRLFRLPVDRIAMVLTLSFRFLPVLLERAEEISISQLSRGANLDSKKPMRRARSLFPLILPLFVACFREAESLSVAMASRCYGEGRKRTSYRVTRLRAGDLLAILIVTALTVGVTILLH